MQLFINDLRGGTIDTRFRLLPSAFGYLYIYYVV